MVCLVGEDRISVNFLITYWFVAYAYWLVFFISLRFLGFDLNALSYFYVLALNLLYLILLSSIAIIIIYKSGLELSGKLFGLSVIDPCDTFLYSGLAMILEIILVPFSLYLIIYDGCIESFVLSSLPQFIARAFPRIIVPIIGILHWTISGVVSFVLLQAFPYEIAERHIGSNKAFLVTLVLWIGLYNGLFYVLVLGLPLQVTVLGEVIDVIILGIAYLLVYRKVRSIIGLLIAYVFVYEAPVKACIYYGWGRNF